MSKHRERPSFLVILWNMLNNFILFVCKVVTYFSIPVTLWFIIQNAFLDFDSGKTLVYLAVLFIVVEVNRKLNGGH